MKTNSKFYHSSCGFSIWQAFKENCSKFGNEWKVFNNGFNSY